jgi:hypothetical protein
MERRDVMFLVIVTLMLTFWVVGGMQQSTSATVRPALGPFNRDMAPRASVRQHEPRVQLPSPPAYHCYKDARVGMACYPY